MNGGETMSASYLSKVGSNLVKRYGTRDPFRIAKELGIVKYRWSFCDDCGCAYIYNLPRDSLPFLWSREGHQASDSG